MKKLTTHVLLNYLNETPLISRDLKPLLLQYYPNQTNEELQEFNKLIQNLQSSKVCEVWSNGVLGSKKAGILQTINQVPTQGKLTIEGVRFLKENPGFTLSMNESDRKHVLKIKLFISYCSLDNDKVKLLKNVINKSGVYEAVIVADRKRPSLELTTLVENGIKESKFLIPILTHNSFKEQWINQEIGFASGIGIPIIPIVELDITEDLKAFIHNQKQLPYGFKSDLNKGKENRQFSKECKKLIDELQLIEKVEAEKNEPVKENPPQVISKSDFQNKINEIHKDEQIARERIKYLESPEALKDAEAELKLIIKDAREKIMKIENPEQGIYIQEIDENKQNPFISFGTEGIRLSFKWSKSYNNHIKNSGLNVQLFKEKGHHGFDYKTTKISNCNYNYDLENGLKVWRNVEAKIDFFDSSALVDRWVLMFFNELQEVLKLKREQEANNIFR